MAMTKLYTYEFYKMWWPKFQLIRPDLRENRLILLIHDKIVPMIDRGEFFFPEYPVGVPGHPKFSTLAPVTLEELQALPIQMAVGMTTVVIPDLQPTHTHEYLDYSKTITQLEKAGLVQTKLSTLMMATDGRKFVYKGEEWEVDCLGTSLCQEVTDEIVALWRHLGEIETL